MFREYQQAVDLKSAIYATGKKLLGLRFRDISRVVKRRGCQVGIARYGGREGTLGCRWCEQLCSHLRRHGHAAETGMVS